MTQVSSGIEKAWRGTAPFHETMRELLEMRYLWHWALRLDNARLVAELGSVPHTPLDLTVERTLAGLGCIAPGAGINAGAGATVRSVLPRA